MKSVLSDFVWVSGKEWRFRLTADLQVKLGRDWKGFHEFRDGGTPWAILIDDTLTIYAGYAWDGCSPAWRIFGKWFGTPTPPSAMVPSLVHDVLYQFMDLRCAPWDKKAADEIFWNLMLEFDFRLRGTYHGAVSIFGAAFRRICKKNPNICCHEHHETL